MTRKLVRDFGTSLRFNSARTSLVTAVGTTPTVTTAFTIALWLNTDTFIKNQTASSTGRIIRTNDDGINLLMRQTTNVIELKLVTTQGSTPRPMVSSFVLPPGKWHFIVAQYDKVTGLLEIYVDNVLGQSVARDGTNIICDNAWRLGDATDSMVGILDEVAVYNIAFNSAQRTAAYYNGEYPTTGKVFHYKFDEGSGTSATDSSGNAKTGTITNGTYTTDVPIKSRTSSPSRITSTYTLLQSASSPNINCHQGIATDGTYFYGIDTNIIYKFDSSWNIVDSLPAAGTAAGINHLGGGQCLNGFLYVAAQNYTSEVNFDSMRIAVYDTSDMSFVATHDISAQPNEVSGLCIDESARIIYVCNYVTGDKLYKYDLDTFTYLGSLTLSRPLDQTQDLTMKDGYFYIGENISNRIYRVNMSGTVIGHISFKVPSLQEGLDFTTDKLYALDGNNEVVWTLEKLEQRRTIDSNLVRNGDFEKVPPFTAVQTLGAARWVDGTSGGYASNDPSIWGWKSSGTNATARYDSTVARAGTHSMKLSLTGTGALASISSTSGTTVALASKWAIPLTPGISYTFSGWMKTNYISGDSAHGAQLALIILDNSGNTLTTVLAGSYVKVTQDWTFYTTTFTPAAGARYGVQDHRVYGHTGAATLLMDVWFDDIDIRPTTPLTRQAA
jgi:hypothetical protein